MNKNFIIGGVIIFGLFVIGLIWLASQDANQGIKENDALGDTFAQYAQELGLDTEKFISDYNSASVNSSVEKDTQDATELGVNATPTLMINDEKLQYNTYDDIKGLIDTKIAEGSVQEITDPDHTKGAESPKVLIVEFSDFQCPACASFTPFVSQIIADYPSDVAVHYRHFPLPMHPSADEAARAAEAAAEQGKFWEMHDILFERQNDWS